MSLREFFAELTSEVVDLQEFQDVFIRTYL